MEKNNIVPILKKGDEQTIKNYHRVSLYRHVGRYVVTCFILKCSIFIRKCDWVALVHFHAFAMKPLFS